MITNHMPVLIKRLLGLRIVRYGLTGGTATLIHFSLAVLLLAQWPQAFALANFCGFGVAFVFSYLVQACWVFENKRCPANALRFLLVQLTALCFSVWLSSQLNQFHNIIKVGVVIVLLPALTFVIHRFWTFSRAESS